MIIIFKGILRINIKCIVIIIGKCIVKCMVII